MVAKWFNRFHLFAHFFLGLLIGLVAAEIEGVGFSQVVVFAVVGSFLPDADHFLFFYTYGRKSNYARKVRGYISRARFVEAARFCGNNHKQLHGLYSHTWYGIGLAALVAVASWNYSIETGVLFLGMVVHFLYDIFEDLILIGRINCNWRGQVVRDDF